ncbi:hypothetical protein FXF51_50235 [Nonomuraea sp. PA05]|uniref:hypothetical protein n=1 Tax=Nonomuraea sp. PA05 TaxID=2604466 RepID=UPI0011D8ADF6|nr:hypothetical protein [Nonomuraea sp. PA05]TYB52970.1 hypothetical protein FXF51_50235 [Nonomuraea sp. PA05]
MSGARRGERTLARRYWDALIDSRPYELGDLRVRRDLSLWQRYWIALLGLPPPTPEPLPAAEPARARWTLSLGRVLLPVAMTATLVAASVLTFRLFTIREPNPAGPAAASPVTPPTATSPADGTATPASSLAYDDVASFPVPAAGNAMDLWKLTPDGPAPAEAGDADLVLARDGVYVDQNRTLVVTSREQCRSSPPVEGVTAGERRARPHQRLCILTHASDLAYVIFADPAAGRVNAAITLWAAGQKVTSGSPRKSAMKLTKKNPKNRKFSTRIT